MKLSPFVRFLELLDSMPDVHADFFENNLQRYRVDFLTRGWVRVAGYTNLHMADFFDDYMEVEIEIDEAAEVYRYQNPERRYHTVVAPLWEVTYYNLNLDKWFNDLCDFIGIEPSHRQKKRDHVPGHLWHLGKVRIGSSHQFAEVFVARRYRSAGDALIKAALDDAVDPGRGIVLVDSSTNPKAFGEHIERCLADLVEFEGRLSTFRKDMLDRILMRYTAIRQEECPDEYFYDNQLMLAHFSDAMTLAPEQTKIVSAAWGAPPKKPPVMSWHEINKDAKTGYNSLDDAFGSRVKCQLVFDRVERGKYRIRRGEMQKPQIKPQMLP